MRSTASGWRDAAAGAAVLAACVVTPLVWWSLRLGPMRSGGVPTLFTYDEYQYSLPALEYAAQAFRARAIPLWNPTQLCGTPYLAAQLHGALYPLHWLVAIWDVPQVLRWMLFLHSMLAIGGTYWCARGFGVGRTAALLGGVTYAFSGTVTGVNFASMEPGPVIAAWLPWQLGLTRKVLRTDAPWGWYAVGLGATTALCIVGGHIPMLADSFYLCGGYAIAQLVVTAHRAGAKAAGSQMVRLGVAGVVLVTLSAVQLFPTLELGLRSPRQPGALTKGGGTDPPAWLPPDQLLRDILYPWPRAFGLGGEGHVGTAALALAAVPLLWRRTRQRGIFFWTAAIAATLIALGDHTPVYRWYLHLPGSSLIRIPQRFMLIAALCLSLLGAIGADTLRRHRRMSEVAISTAAGVGLLAILWWVLRAVNVQWQQGDASAVAALRQHGMWFVAWGALFALPRRWFGAQWRRALVVVVVAASVVELYGSIGAQFSIPADQPDALRVPWNAAAFILQRQGLTRTFAPNGLSSEDALLREIPPKLGMLTGLSVIGDYEVLIDSRYNTLVNQIEGVAKSKWGGFVACRIGKIGPQQSPLLRVLGVGFVLIHRDAAIDVSGLPPAVYRDADYEVYEIAEPLPRAYVATHAWVAPTAEQALAAVVNDTALILGHGVVVERPELAAYNSEGRVAVTEYAPQRVELQAQLERPGLVVLQDQFDPYWTATVDGQAAEIVRANYAFRAVAVDAGAHTVRFVYRPWLLYAGAATTLASVIVLLALGLLSLLRWRRKALIPLHADA